ncbi:Aminodeoxyfutalosine deaminase [Rubripirellula amarantea]|uniref:Aminodeoxyfutalosine deaminase n=1 Tax=Rubripirellula amarantea TaxID=2527999 RepID=A0A5C5WVA8_9BACT|nr:amidohydrolase family protein [Rubripirellula amarantea]TWT54189.1 Aminodeoxyfutalosine deaminase [Rubripirellula amarantea]
MNEASRLIAARWILPVNGKPIRGGWIECRGQDIVALGKNNPPGKVDDLGDVAILPGLVNAHTHLEFSDFKQPVGHRGIAFDQWIAKVVQSRGQQGDVATAISQGIRESLDSGVRLIGEIATPSTVNPPPVVYPPPVDGLDMVTFAEVLGLNVERASERFAAMNDLASRVTYPGVSPHAPYSTLPKTIQRCVNWSSRFARPLAMHVAESPGERELLVSGTGPIADALKAMGVFNDALFPRCDQPFIELIDQLSKASSVLLIHGNDLREHEIDLISTHSHISVVFCPRTHDFFQFARHPVEKLLAAGVNVALGTDSRASNPDLHLWNEVRFLLRHRMDLQPAEVLKMATANGADALGRPDLGRIAPGTRPGLIGVPTTASSEPNLYRDLSEGMPIVLGRNQSSEA